MAIHYLAPVITVFDKNGGLDKDGNRRVYDRLIAGGVDGLVVMGSTGEFPTMPEDMKKELISLAVEHVKGRCLVLAGTGCLRHEDTIALSNFAYDKGVDGVMIVGPYYFGVPDAGVFAYFDAVVSKVAAPVYLYNYPERTGYSIAVSVARDLVRKHRNIVGFKDTITDMGHTADLIRAIRPDAPDFAVYSGFDNNFAHNIASGGNGCIGGLANLVPEICAEWKRAVAALDWERAAGLQKRVDAMMEIYSVALPFIPAMKKAMILRGLEIDETCLLPLLPVNDEQTRRIREILQTAGIM